MPPCNCGKNRQQTQPSGSGKMQPKQGSPIVQAKPATKQGQQHASVVNRAQTFELRTTSGKTAQFGSRLEALAARKRAGGGTITPR